MPVQELSSTAFPTGWWGGEKEKEKGGEGFKDKEVRSKIRKNKKCMALDGWFNFSSDEKLPRLYIIFFFVISMEEIVGRTKIWRYKKDTDGRENGAMKKMNDVYEELKVIPIRQTLFLPHVVLPPQKLFLPWRVELD